MSHDQINQTGPAHVANPAGEPTAIRVVPWYFTRTMVFLFIFFIAGALALPFLWFSPAFRLLEKVLWSLLAIAYTAFATFMIAWMSLLLWRLSAALLT